MQSKSILNEKRISKEMKLTRIKDLSKNNVSEKVRVAGWLQFKRMGGQFLVLRDSYGYIQVVILDPLVCNSRKLNSYLYLYVYHMFSPDLVCIHFFIFRFYLLLKTFL